MLGTVGFLEGQWWRMHFLLSQGGIQQVQMLVVAKRSLAAVSLAGGGRGGHGGLLPLNFSVALTLSIGAITLTVIHKYYIYEIADYWAYHGDGKGSDASDNVKTR